MDEFQKKQLKLDYKGWEEIQERKKELANEEKSLREDAANILETKPAKVGKLFKVIYKKIEDGIDEVDELRELMAEFEN